MPIDFFLSDALFGSHPPPLFFVSLLTVNSTQVNIAIKMRCKVRQNIKLNYCRSDEEEKGGTGEKNTSNDTLKGDLSSSGQVQQRRLTTLKNIVKLRWRASMLPGKVVSDIFMALLSFFWASYCCNQKRLTKSLQNNWIEMDKIYWCLDTMLLRNNTIPLPKQRSKIFSRENLIWFCNWRH